MATLEQAQAATELMLVCLFIYQTLLCVCLACNMMNSLITIHSSFCTLHTLLEFAFFFFNILAFFSVIANFQFGTKCAPSVGIFRTSYKEQRQAVASSSCGTAPWKPQHWVTAHGHTTEHMSHDKCLVQRLLVWIPVMPPVRQWGKKGKEKIHEEKLHFEIIFKYLPSYFLWQSSWSSDVCMNV